MIPTARCRNLTDRGVRLQATCERLMRRLAEHHRIMKNAGQARRDKLHAQRLCGMLSRLP